MCRSAGDLIVSPPIWTGPSKARATKRPREPWEIGSNRPIAREAPHSRPIASACTSRRRRRTTTLTSWVSAWYQDDYPYYAQGGDNFAPLEMGLNFCIDLRFSSLRNTGRFGPAETALQTRGIRALTFIIQPGGPGGGEQVAITRIETVDAATAAARPCRRVV